MNNIKTRLYQLYIKVDTFLAKYLVDQKLRKIVYIAIPSIIAFMVVLIAIASIFTKANNKVILPKETPTPISQEKTPTPPLTPELSDLNTLYDEISEMGFPSNTLKIPSLEFNIKID